MSRWESEARGVISAGLQLWDYSPSHRRLLFRGSSKADGQSFNVDLTFVGVREIWFPLQLISKMTIEAAEYHSVAVCRFGFSEVASIVADNAVLQLNFLDPMQSGLDLDREYELLRLDVALLTDN